jgi:hypothetical protein
MHILIGLAMGVALLYFWLVGHWFARVLVFLALGAGLFVGGAAIGSAAGDQSSWLVLGLLGAVVAWFVSGIPTYYWLHRLGYQSRLRKWLSAV